LQEDRWSRYAASVSPRIPFRFLHFPLPASLKDIQNGYRICKHERWLTRKFIAAAHNLTIENEKITIEDAENLQEYMDTKTLSGTPLGRFFCKTCGK
jgi:hypothetical protein